jgi:hypothetical protein
MLRRSSALPTCTRLEHDIVAADEALTVRYVVEAAHQGKPPGATRTGQRVHWDDVDVYHLADRMMWRTWPAPKILRCRRAAPTPIRQDPAPASETEQASQTVPTAHSDNCLGPEHVNHVSNKPETRPPAVTGSAAGSTPSAHGSRSPRNSAKPVQAAAAQQTNHGLHWSSQQWQ